jgi:hypothetical protein
MTNTTKDKTKDKAKTEGATDAKDEGEARGTCAREERAEKEINVMAESEEEGST